MSDDRDPLDNELANLKKLNGVLENVISALDASTINTENVNSTVQNADKLLDLWIRVLARSDQAQKLILNENWHGATSDLQAIEAEQSQAFKMAQEKQQAIARREKEEREARERREREESERLSSSTSTGTRGRGSTRGRGISGTTRGTVKKEVVSAYAQTARPKLTTSRPAAPPASAQGPSTTRQSMVPQPGTTGAGTGRGRGGPVVRGTRASRGRQQGLGRSTNGGEAGFK